MCIAHGGGKRCTEPDCTKATRGASDKCIAHGGGLRCTQPDCTKAAADPSDKCKTHGGGRRCAESGCTKSAAGAKDKCKAHGGGNRCTEPECTKSAEGATDKCVSHGGGKRCTEPGCTKSTQGATDMCIAHGGGKRCAQPECTKSAVGASDKCKAHGGGKRCTAPDCTKSAEGATDKCIAHGGGRRCPNCVDWIDSRCGQSKYDGYCATCFKRVFPDDPRSTVIYEHTKEICVRNFINERYEGFVHDTPMWLGGCDCTHKRRIDHRKLIGGVMLAVETDEFGHRSYDKRDEEIRYDDVVMIHTGPWVFIRFNPDDNYSGKGVDMEDKLERLGEEMDKHIERIERGLVDASAGLVEIHKLFF